MDNESFGWLCISLGFVSGTLLGLRFHRDDWLGGYASLSRRMLRLGHISLVALGMLNVLLARSIENAALDDGRRALVSWGLMIGAVAMPAVCGLTAWRAGFRRLFFIPVTSLLVGSITLTLGVVRS